MDTSIYNEIDLEKIDSDNIELDKIDLDKIEEDKIDLEKSDDKKAVDTLGNIVIPMLLQLEKDINAAAKFLEPEKWAKDDQQDCLQLVLFQITCFTTKFPKFKKKCEDSPHEELPDKALRSKYLTYGGLNIKFEEAENSATTAVEALCEDLEVPVPSIEETARISTSTFRELALRATLNVRREQIFRELEPGGSDEERLARVEKIICEST
jgi:hypothetical protein